MNKASCAIAEIVPLTPQGTNSTMFTACCEVAICGDQAKCPHCGGLVVGHDAADAYERSRIRWKNATRYWNRKKNAK